MARAKMQGGKPFPTFRPGQLVASTRWTLTELALGQELSAGVLHESRLPRPGKGVQP